METVNISKDNEVINSVDIQIQDAIYYFEFLNRRREEIKIYMPEYFNRMFMYHKVMPPRHGKMTSYHGIDIVDGYENAIIISIKNNVIYSIEPIKIEL